MFLETIEGEDGAYLQALVKLPTALASQKWWAAYERRVGAIAGLGGVSSAFRLVAPQNGPISRLISITVKAGEEQLLRRYLARLQWLEGVQADSVQSPASADEYQDWAADFPATGRRVLPPALSVSAETWLDCGFRVADHLPSLTAEASALGVGFSYQINFLPFQPDAEQLRRTGRNLLRLETVNGLPAPILAEQRGLVTRLRGAKLLFEEIVAGHDEDADHWLDAALGRRFREAPARATIEGPRLEAQPAGQDDGAVSLMMHSSLLYGEAPADDLLCSQSADEAFRVAVMSVRPVVEIIVPPSDDEDERPRGATPPSPASAPIAPNATEGQKHVFVSYKHADMDRVAPTLVWLNERGFPFWYDRGIEGGEEWDAVLERKIEQAGVLLFFSSQLSVDSKYCRREVKFADAIDKPIVTVALEPVTMAHGLRFLLMHLQEISAGDHEFNVRLERALRLSLERSTATPAAAGRA